MNLTELIENDIKENGVKQKWLAEQLGITPATIINILKGNKASNRTMRAIARHYDLEIKEVVKYNDNQQVRVTAANS